VSPRRLAAAALVVAVSAWMASAALAPRLSAQSAAPARQQPYSKVLPPGDGVELVGANCVLCHSSMLITQQHKDSTGWEKTVQLMERWGARLVPDEHAKVIAYLVANFGPAPP